MQLQKITITRLKRRLPAKLKALIPPGLKERIYRLSVPAQKVFGIGLPKTATTSLTEALTMLDYASIHYPRPGHEIWRYETATDAPVAATWRELDEDYPGSRFVLTLRELESWLESCRRHFSEHKENPYRMQLFGTYVFEETKFRECYGRHHDAVRAHFKTRCGDLLELDICAGEGWEKLCPFLRRAIPQSPFPWHNRREDTPGV